MLYSSALDTIGNTPLIELVNIEKKYHLNCQLFAKVEGFNLGGSIKSRPALFIINDALKNKKINKDTIVIEPTSGNMGISLALICALYDIPFIAIMPDNVSLERRKLIELYNGKVILTPKQEGMKGCFKRLEELKKMYKDVYVPSQFNNPLSIEAHYLTTGKEILNDLPNVDAFVSGVGTGGTIMGVSKRLKEDHRVFVIAVEPKSSPMLSFNKAGEHKIQGIGANFYPPLVDKAFIDDIALIDDNEAFKGVNELAKEEGLLVGISSSAAFLAALKAALSNKYQQIVAIFPDFGDRYLSTYVKKDDNHEKTS